MEIEVLELLKQYKIGREINLPTHDSNNKLDHSFTGSQLLRWVTGIPAPHSTSLSIFQVGWNVLFLVRIHLQEEVPMGRKPSVLKNAITGSFTWLGAFLGQPFCCGASGQTKQNITPCSSASPMIALTIPLPTPFVDG